MRCPVLAGSTTKSWHGSKGLNRAESANLDDYLRSHNPKVVSSNLPPATNLRYTRPGSRIPAFLFSVKDGRPIRPSIYTGRAAINYLTKCGAARLTNSRGVTTLVFFQNLGKCF